MDWQERLQRFRRRRRYGPRGVQRIWSLKSTLLLLVMFQVFDTLSTVLALGTGAGEEANPILREWFESGDTGQVILLKWSVVAFAFVVVALDPRDTKTDFVKWGLITMNIAYAVVLSMNFAVYGAGSGDWMLPAAFWALMLALATVMVDENFFRSRGAVWVVEKVAGTPAPTDESTDDAGGNR